MSQFRLVLMIFVCSIAVSFVPLDSVYAQEAEVVVPNSLTNTDGNASNTSPYSCAVGSQRNQQLYLGTEIGELVIGKISYRLDNEVEDEGGEEEIEIEFNAENPMGFGPTTIPDIQIDMSTTTLVPGAGVLDTTDFDSNRGADNTTVFSGDLVLSAPNCTMSPCPFDITIVLQKPFHFNPANGNLLLDIRVPDCVSLGSELFDDIPFDGSGNTQTSISGMSNSDHEANDGGFPNIVPLVTQFDLGLPIISTPIPTLSEWGLIALAGVLGIVGFMVIRRRKASA